MLGRMRAGYLTVGRFRGIPVRLHWSLPLGALVFGGGRFAPGLWVGFFLLVLLHELGHATVVRHHRMRVLSVEIHALGGLCRWEGMASPLARATIAWGGVWAQLALLLGTVLTLALLGAPRGRFAVEMVEAFTTINLFLVALNLLPVRPLDGAEAWPLLPLLWRRLRSRRRGARSRGARSAPASTPRQGATRTRPEGMTTTATARRGEVPDLRELREQVERLRREASEKVRRGN